MHAEGSPVVLVLEVVLDLQGEGVVGGGLSGVGGGGGDEGCEG